jgi:serine/threonine-protein kinase
MKRGWLVDAIIGLVLTLGVVGGYVNPGLIAVGPALESLELKAYDARAKLRQNLDPSQEIRIIVIDNNSISQLGRWPWPRSRMAALLDKLKPAHPRVVALDSIYSEAERDPGLEELQKIEQTYKELVSSKKLSDKGKTLEPMFSSAEERLDSDAKLAAAVKSAGNVVLAMFGASSGVIGAKPADVPEAISSCAVSVHFQGGGAKLPAWGDQLAYPILPLAEAAMSIGHLNIQQDIDGSIRKVSPVMHYGEYYLPSFAVSVVLAYSGLKPADAVLSPGKEVKLANAAIPLDENSRMLVTFNGPSETFRYYPFVDVMNDKVAMDLFKDKIVLVGVTAGGVATMYVTPVAQSLPPIELTANVIENILHKKFLVRPDWALQLELGMLAFIGLFVMFALPRLKAVWGAAVSFLLLLGMTGVGTYLFVNGEWVKIGYPSVLLLVGYVVAVSKHFFTAEKGKELVEASAIETNKMLGLSFQGQGMLDMAFEKFRLCPLDDNLKDTLYNLALDFERKRQFSKAAAVLDHIAKTDPKYKDIADKTKMLKAASEGAVFGGVGGGKKEGTVMLSGGATKPTLGRYEIEKELGRGAMGIVYLGKDPKINRQVAIKTMVLDEGGDAAEAKAVKERFFREAESAGTLNHPNIVRIFDAGEESDVAYIAMELLDGHDFTQYTQKSHLLPPAQAMEYVAQVADALDYAHSKGIVHRDIKPANFMLLKDGSVRVADFGIARITASSKTATGTVMGTPSYMSPEQVAGKKVDGRSDLFSLSVALYELLAGEKPFKGGEGIGTLLFQIANDPHPDIRTVHEGVPPCSAAIIDKGLAKDPEKRYQRGSELAADLRKCIAAAKDGSAAPPPAAPESAAAAERTDEITAPVVPVAAAPEAEKTVVSAPDPIEPALSPEHAAAESLRTLEFPADATMKLTVPDPPAADGGLNPDATMKLTEPPEAK